MPIYYKNYPEDGYVLTVFDGAVTLPEASAMFRDLFNEPFFNPRHAHLADLSRFHAPDIGFAEVFSLFSLLDRTYESLGHTTRAAIYAPDETVFGLSRIFENLTETSKAINVSLFDDLDAARSWIIDQ